MTNRDKETTRFKLFNNWPAGHEIHSMVSCPPGICPLDRCSVEDHSPSDRQRQNRNPTIYPGWPAMGWCLSPRERILRWTLCSFMGSGLTWRIHG